MKTIDIAQANRDCARHLLARLIKLGVRDVVVSSGARCAPLVLAVPEFADLRVWTHFDERSAAFFALGVSKITRTPTVLICTSGTAGANYYPAIIESSISQVPLIAVTADRPHELHGCGAPQTINQTDLFGSYAKHSVTLPTPEDASTASQWVRYAEESFRTAIAWPPGPVHLNAPFREPLLPEPTLTTSADVLQKDRVGEVVEAGLPPEPGWSRVDELGGLMASSERCLLIAGPMDDSDVEAIARLAPLFGCPLIADVASQLRCSPFTGRSTIAHADLLVRHAGFASEVRPDLIVRFGGLPTSKALNLWLSEQEPRSHVIVSDAEPIADPFRQATQTIRGRPAAIARRLVDRHDLRERAASPYAMMWSDADRKVEEALHARFSGLDELFEGAVVASVFDATNPDAIVMLGNSMPIRWADTYAARRAINLRVLFNRGANGIDGVVSTALGAAAASGCRVVLVVGDVSFMHDLSGLSALLQRDLNVTIVLLNNDGGGIFSFLPLAQHDAIFESLIAMPHGRSFESIARFLGIPYELPTTDAEFRQALADSFGQVGARIIEIRTNRRRTYELSNSIVRAINELELPRR